MAQADQIADTTLPRTTVLAWVPKNSTLLAPPLWQKLLAQVLVEALQLLQLAAELPYSQLELPTAAVAWRRRHVAGVATSIGVAKKLRGALFTFDRTANRR
eukprot:CAMPEP_0178386828 /NCGR_PEP_ID=MMETSP0689_2-20121128/8762_1 /TAXON_ID=160604 /ORGANISM="Amphidinium massartii, Strain CS-259" /LENGTH=100 /DNA_ID=CAMNT_0020007179 /DNA_START=254 /DNA_END=557 /DNA_ORIENTATION=+